MNFKSMLFQLAFLLAGIFLATACSNLTVEPIVTNIATIQPLLATPTDHLLLTQKPASTLPSLTSQPTPILLPTLTSSASNIVESLDVDFSEIVSNGREYDIVESKQFVAESGVGYSIYTIQDSSLKPDEYGLPPANTEICRVVFLETENQRLLGTFVAPSHPKREIFPVSCNLISWQASFSDFLSLSPFGEPFASGVKTWEEQSDINDNGLPEFAVAYQYCALGCMDWGILATHFYEVQPDGTVINLTENLAGIVDPYYQLQHANQPRTLYVYDRGYVGNDLIIDSWWIYEWDGHQYVDATERFSADIELWGTDWLKSVRSEYGSELTQLRWDFGRIVQQFDKANLREEAIAILNEITDPIHWSATDEFELCYLHVMRETALSEYQNNMPFSLPRDPMTFGEFGLPDLCDV